MSKIRKKPISIPDGVNLEIRDRILSFKGKGGEMSVKVLPYMKVDFTDKTLTFSVEKEIKQARSNWGTMRALAQNAVLGVSQGFSKELSIEGVGFRATAEGNNLVLNVGFSHPVKFIPPEGIKISVEKNIIKVSGISKELVGKTAAEIRRIKKPEPYKGKGIRYVGEVVRRKAGKKVAGTTTK